MLQKTQTIILAGVLSALAAAPASASSSARANQCLPHVEQKLAELNVDKAAINKISILPRRQSGQSTSRIIGYDATVSFKTCRGHLAIDMNRVCHTKQVYSRNECKFPGVPNY